MTPTRDGVVLIDQRTAEHGGLPGCSTSGFLITICKSGSYELSGNIDAKGEGAIAITANDVSLNLNGFTISGASGNAAVVTSGKGDSVGNGVIADSFNGIAAAAGSLRALGLTLIGNTNIAFGLGAGASASIVDCDLVNNNAAIAQVSGDSAPGAITVVHSVIQGNSSGVDVPNNATFLKGDVIVDNQLWDISGAAVSAGDNLCTHGSC